MSAGSEVRLSWVSERHLRLVLGSDTSLATHRRVRAACELLRAADIPGLQDLTPAYATVLLSFDALTLEAARAEDSVLRVAAGLEETAEPSPSRLVEIPVCYEGECAPDIDDVAAAHGLTLSEVAELHSGAEYVVWFVGFVPGFAYLGGLPRVLATPRLERPRVRVPAGSVGIAGEQTGVYPFATAGGWRLIGRTPLKVFDPKRERPGLMEMGDRVRFVPIGMERFGELVELEGAGVGKAGRRPAPPRRLVLPQRAASPGRPGFMRVIEPGMFTTVQDLGREGFAAAGAPVGGAADSLSLRVGNRLVGNEDGAAGLEMTLTGGVFEFENDAVVALVGGEIQARVEGGRAIERGAAERVMCGERLHVGPIRRGARVYLCVGGGVRVAEVMGSRSTHMAAGMGGFEGRALRAGDRVEFDGGGSVARLSVEGAALLRESLDRRTFRIVLGAGFTSQSVEAFLGSEYKVLAQSDRVGLRLEGQAIAAPDGGRMMSEGMMWGAVQAPENGKPIVLMSDHPTTGGYPVIGCIASVDLPTLGQLRPGDVVRFEPVDSEEARVMLRERELRLDAAIEPILFR